MYQNATPVSRVMEGSTTHFTNNPHTTVTMLPNANGKIPSTDFSAVGTTFDVNDKTTIRYPVLNESESADVRFANDGKYIL